MSKLCPCGNSKTYSECCEPYIENHIAAPDPECLMRSRYTAYTLAAIDYIAMTMLPPASNGFDPKSAEQWAKTADWQGLEVRGSEQPTPDCGIVEFIAHYKQDGQPRTLHEISQFKRQTGRWYYVDGTHPAKPGRNDPCSCGSTKKFKKCCGK